jgi:hypothetical protein
VANDRERQPLDQSPHVYPNVAHARASSASFATMSSNRISKGLPFQLLSGFTQSAMSASRRRTKPLSRWAASVGVRGWRPGQREASLCLKIMGFEPHVRQEFSRCSTSPSARCASA